VLSPRAVDRFFALDSGFRSRIGSRLDAFVTLKRRVGPRSYELRVESLDDGEAGTDRRLD
jgi:hypothetical protein